MSIFQVVVISIKYELFFSLHLTIEMIQDFIATTSDYLNLQPRVWTRERLESTELHVKGFNLMIYRTNVLTYI